MKKTPRSLALLAPLALLFLVTTALADEPSDLSQAREITVTARKFEFVPKTISVRKGESVKLIVTSEDVDHGFALKEFGIKETIKAKQTKVIELTPDREGKFEFA